MMIIRDTIDAYRNDEKFGIKPKQASDGQQPQLPSPETADIASGRGRGSSSQDEEDVDIEAAEASIMGGDEEPAWPWLSKAETEPAVPPEIRSRWGLALVNHDVGFSLRPPPSLSG